MAWCGGPATAAVTLPSSGRIDAGKGPSGNPASLCRAAMRPCRPQGDAAEARADERGRSTRDIPSHRLWRLAMNSARLDKEPSPAGA
jgi:hypothetical protein